MEFGAAREHTSPLNLHPAPDTIAAMSSQYSAVEVILPREVPLGGPRAMTVHRTIPHRQRPMIGAQLRIASGAEVELALRPRSSTAYLSSASRT